MEETWRKMEENAGKWRNMKDNLGYEMAISWNLSI